MHGPIRESHATCTAFLLFGLGLCLGQPAFNHALFTTIDNDRLCAKKSRNTLFDLKSKRVSFITLTKAPLACRQSKRYQIL